MAMMPPDDVNPFRAPAATIGGPSHGGAGSDAELIRRKYLSHEASVKAVGSLLYINAFFAGVFAVIYAVGAVGLFQIPVNNANNSLSPQIILGISSFFSLIFLFLYGGWGYGLRRLQVWARWVTIVLLGLGLFGLGGLVVALAFVNPAMAGGAAVGAIIPGLIVGYLFYLVASAKGAMVFSADYHEIIRATPHIKYKTSIIVKILLGLLVGILLLLLIGAIISSFSSR